MNWLRLLTSFLRGTLDRDAYAEYRTRLLNWARDAHGLKLDEYRTQFEGRYLEAGGRDLFLDYLLSASKESPSYITEDAALLADRTKLFDRFGLPVLTPHELRDQENKRLGRLGSPLRL